MSQPDWIITAEELKKVLKTQSSEKSVTLVDVRELEEYKEVRIEGCRLIPLGELKQRAPTELNPSDDIILYCAHGIRSLQAVMVLRMMGFERLRSLEGGIESWLQLSP